MVHVRDVPGSGVSRKWTACWVFIARSCRPLDVAYCLAQPWLVLCAAPASVFTSAHDSAANTLTLLIKMSETVTVYRGYRRTLFFLPRIISLFVVCVGIIWNNSSVGWRALAKVWNLAPGASRSTAKWRSSARPLGFTDRYDVDVAQRNVNILQRLHSDRRSGASS